MNKNIKKFQDKIRKLGGRNAALAFAIKKADNYVKNMSEEQLLKELKKEGVDTKDVSKGQVKKVFKEK